MSKKPNLDWLRTGGVAIAGLSPVLAAIIVFEPIQPSEHTGTVLAAEDYKPRQRWKLSIMTAHKSARCRYQEGRLNITHRHVLPPSFAFALLAAVDAWAHTEFQGDVTTMAARMRLTQVRELRIPHEPTGRENRIDTSTCCHY